MPCKHAELAAIYAKQMAKMDDPWKLWEGRGSDKFGWIRFNGHFVFDDRFEYRQIPKTIRIGKYDVPEPMREKPRHGSKYWYIHPDAHEGVYDSTWTDHRIDNMRLSRNICHSTRDNCIIHAKALFSFSEVG